MVWICLSARDGDKESKRWGEKKRTLLGSVGACVRADPGSHKRRALQALLQMPYGIYSASPGSQLDKSTDTSDPTFLSSSPPFFFFHVQRRRRRFRTCLKAVLELAQRYLFDFLGVVFSQWSRLSPPSLSSHTHTPADCQQFNG